MTLEHSDTLSRQIWDMKYRFRNADGGAIDNSVEDTWDRVAKAVSRAEAPDKAGLWEKRFRAALQDYRFLPAGRILAGAGTRRNVTLFNCFVMGEVQDDLSGIFENLKETALTLQQGGGAGLDFSTLRPKGARVEGVGADASGPISFMDVWDAMCRTIQSAGARRGAMMAVMDCSHPDIEDFIEAKRDGKNLRMFNLSVLITDAFMQAVKANRDWDLEFAGKIWKTLPARNLWEKIMRSAYEYAEPGVVFIDRINQLNNLSWLETIKATNPCGEQPLPPYGACLLGSVNLARLIKNPFTEHAGLDEKELAEIVPVTVRFLDNVIDISNYPLEAQKREAISKRRIGLGVTGLADALMMCRLRYGSKSAAAMAAKWMKLINDAAYAASIALAKEKGAFPLFDAHEYLQGKSVKNLDEKLRDGIAANGIRNGLVTSIAPTGTISLFAGNVSSGIEPVFSLSHERAILQPDGSRRHETVSDYASRIYGQIYGMDAELPDSFVTAQTLEPGDHLAMQAAMQPFVDSAISKTINCPANISFAAFRDIYLSAYDLGLKGCTAYRPNPVTGSVLKAGPETQKTVEPEQPMLPLEAPPAPAMPKNEGDVIYITQPFERDNVLPGFTYKLRWPESDHAIYITLNDIIQDGRRRPFEIFINSKNMEHYAWTVALTRMISAVFRRGGDVSFVVEELQAVFDPRGGQWMNGRYVPSLLAAIGHIIEEHMVETGFLTREEGLKLSQQTETSQDIAASALRYCPKCDAPTLVFQEGCHTCLSCGYSKCS